MRWTFEQAYPVKWSGPQFKADDNAVAVETLELAHEGMKIG
jgi:phage tail-like protein